MIQFEITQEQKSAHERLQFQLPSRFHNLGDDPIVWNRPPDRSRPVIAWGKWYRSMREAARQNGKNMTYVYRRVKKKVEGFSFA